MAIVTVKGDQPFVEEVYDLAFGMGKSLMLKGGTSSVRRRRGFVLTAKRNNDSVIVTIWGDSTNSQTPDPA